MSKPSPKPTGFEESPQAEFEGVPYSGNVSDWVRELEAAGGEGEPQGGDAGDTVEGGDAPGQGGEGGAAGEAG